VVRSAKWGVSAPCWSLISIGGAWQGNRENVGSSTGVSRRRVPLYAVDAFPGLAILP